MREMGERGGRIVSHRVCSLLAARHPCELAFHAVPHGIVDLVVSAGLGLHVCHEMSQCQRGRGYRSLRRG